MEKKTLVKVVLAERVLHLEPSHAERLLGMANNGGWALPENSPYNFTKKAGLTVKPHNRNKKDGPALKTKRRQSTETLNDTASVQRSVEEKEQSSDDK